ncbi:NepR family anti-sigma factor [Lichenifustis flavocetrariae]|uniref:Anti-sigma factor NepR domain-containing protein n=1 Tax=Lichenifustis flavocetrariae TaxID=2949735 RepID=A0AA41YTQ5_9HYPH|nr:NepR family anti-sigma factor [Lichenifustis flavocetrariae]MCW6507046.1 hypothetical protein [Lichenifustis flavocetrariae]
MRPLDEAGVVVTDTAVHAEELDVDEDEGSDVAPKPVSSDMQQFIGRQLRAVFDDVAKQPVPDRFLELMKQLEQKTGT